MDSTKNNQFNGLLRSTYQSKEKLNFNGYECKKVEPKFENGANEFFDAIAAVNRLFQSVDLLANTVILFVSLESFIELKTLQPKT